MIFPQNLCLLFLIFFCLYPMSLSWFDDNIIKINIKLVKFNKKDIDSPLKRLEEKNKNLTIVNFFCKVYCPKKRIQCLFIAKQIVAL